MSLSPSLNLETVLDVGFTDDAGNPLKGSFVVVGSTVRRTSALGNVIGPGAFTITLDASGNLSKQLPANIDSDIQDLGDDYYTVTPNLTDATGKPLTKPLAPFRMVLTADAGPYRLSDFIFGDQNGNPRSDLSAVPVVAATRTAVGTVTASGTGTARGRGTATGAVVAGGLATVATSSSVTPGTALYPSDTLVPA